MNNKKSNKSSKPSLRNGIVFLKKGIQTYYAKINELNIKIHDRTRLSRYISMRTNQPVHYKSASIKIGDDESLPIPSDATIISTESVPVSIKRDLAYYLCVNDKRRTSLGGKALFPIM